MLGFLAFEKAVLQIFESFIEVDLTHRKDPHTLQPSADREPTVQCEPNEGAHLAGARAVPNFGQHLGVHGVVEVQLLDEGVNGGDLGHSLRVLVALLGQVTEERCVPQWGRSLPMPFSQVPRKAFNEADLEDPEEGGFRKE